MNEKIENYTLYCQYYDELKINKNLAFFESHNSIDFAGNMLAIAKELSLNPNYLNVEMIVSCTIESKIDIEKLLEKYGIERTKLVVRESPEYFYALATAKYLFTDVAYYSLYRKKKGQVCISTWHGTPLKTLGFTFFEDSYVVANQKRGFLLADYFVCPNEYTWNCIKESYQLDGLFKGKVIFGGYPRNSIFFDEFKRKERKEDLECNDKKIVVYMPTWRGRVIQVNDKGQSVELQKILEDIDNRLPDEYEIWAKLHRLNQNELDYSMFSHIKPFPKGYDTYDVLNVADILVTDYSSVMFDFLSTRKKIILYCYDKVDYVENRGCYFDIDELPFPIVSEIDSLIKEICSEKKYDDNLLVEQFCSEDSIQSSNKIVSTIIMNKCNCKSVKLKVNRKEKKLIFVGDLNENNATDAVFEFLEKQNKDTIYITYMNHLFKDKGYKLLQFKNINQIPMYMYQGRYSNYTKEESLLMNKLRENIHSHREISFDDWKRVQKIFRREYVRYTYENKFDIFIRFAGLDLESLKWLSIFSGKKILYIHDNMIEKAQKNYEFQVYLKLALDSADRIHFANQEVYKQSEKLFENFSNKIVIEDMY